MTATLTVTPNPVAPGANFDIAGAGFDPKKKVQLAYNGTGYTSNVFRPRRDGSFVVGMKADTTDGPDTVTARLSGSTTVLATATVTVQTTVTPPPVTSPFPGFAKAEAAVAAGGTVDVPTGTYRERFTLSKPGVTWRLASGAVIDLSGFAIPVQASGVVIAGDDISFVGNGEITGSTASGYTVDGDRVTITVNVHHCVEEGYVWHGSNGRMVGGSNHHNNETGQFWDSGEQGAGKANCQNLLIDGVEFYNIGLGGASDDAGQGPWYDSIGQTSSGELRNCRIHDIRYCGPMFEISRFGKIHDNVVYRCGTGPNRPWQSSGIFISSSQDVDVYNNTVAYSKFTGVRVVCQTRGDRPGITARVAVHDNTFIGNPTAFGFDSDMDATSTATMFAAASGNMAYRNRLDVPRAFWKPQGMLSTLAAINALPGGGGSTVMTAAEVTAALAAAGIA